MTINVTAPNATITVIAGQPLIVTLNDSSGAHVVVIAYIAGLPPINHPFIYGQGSLQFPIPALASGTYACAFSIQVFLSDAVTGTYDDQMLVNGVLAATANGSLGAGATSDSGYGLFNLVVK
jgi:hypothetical protein